MYRLNITLMYAVENNELSLVNKLLTAGANVDFVDKDANGNTPLHEAVLARNLDMCKLLISKKAPLNTKNCSRQTPRDLAASTWGQDVLAVLDEYVTLSSKEDELMVKIIQVTNNLSPKDTQSVHRRDSLTPKETYKRREGTGGINGQLYESKLLALILFRLTRFYRENKIKRFRIGANIDDAGHFDDVLVRYCNFDEKQHYIFIQAKHREEPTKKKIIFDISSKTTNVPAGTFSLKKNFENYLTLRKNFKRIFNANFNNSNTMFVLYTSGIVEINENNEHHFEQFSVDDEDLLKTSISGLKIKIKHDPSVEIEWVGVAKEEFMHFLDSFWIYSSQAKQDEVGEILQRDILHIENTINDKMLFDNFHSIIQEHWLQTGDVSYLDEKNDFLELVKNFITLCFLTQSFVYSMNSYDIEFKENAVESLNIGEILGKQEQIVPVLSSFPMLTAAKVWHHLQNKSSKPFCIIDTERIDVNFDLYGALRSDTQFRIVVLIFSKMEAIDDILPTLTQYGLDNKNVVLVIDKDFLFRLTCFPKIFCDNFNNLSDFSTNCQDRILNSAIVYVSQVAINIGKLVGTTKQNLCNIIDFKVLRKILNKQPLYLIPVTVSNSLELINHYVKRKITYCNLCLDFKHIRQNSLFCIIERGTEMIENNDKEVIVISQTCELFNKIFKKHFGRSIHWFKKIGDDLCWQQSSKCLNYLSKYIFRQTIQVNTLDDVHDRVTILAAEPGMGKTTILTGLTENAKQNDDFTCVIRINLLDYFQQFKEMNEPDIDLQASLLFVLKNGFSVNDSVKLELQSDEIKSYRNNDDQALEDMALFRVAIFAELYNNGKINVLFDGFDEITNKYEIPVLKLLKELKSSRIAKMVVTTRTNRAMNILEDGLKVFVDYLEPFTDSDISQFFLNRWRLHPDVLDKDEKIKEFITELITHFSKKMVTGSENFLRVPLHAEMITKCFEEHLVNFCNDENGKHPKNYIVKYNVDLISLYERFIEIKIKIFLEEKCKLTVGNPNFSEQSFNKQFIEKHKRLALITLFDGEDLELLLPSEERAKYLDDLEVGVEKKGVICKIINGKPLFVHLSFAEYFAAVKLWSSMLSSSPVEFRTLYEKILLENLVKNDRRQICKFLQSLILRNKTVILHLSKKAYIVFKSIDSAKLENPSFGLILGIFENSLENNAISKQIDSCIENQPHDQKLKFFTTALQMGYRNLVRAFNGKLERLCSREEFIQKISDPLINALENGPNEIAKILIKQYGYRFLFQGVLASKILDLSYGSLEALISDQIFDCNKAVFFNNRYVLPLNILLEKGSEEKKVLLFLKNTKNIPNFHSNLMTNYEKNINICERLFTYSKSVTDYFLNANPPEIFLDNITLEKILSDLEQTMHLKYFTEKGLGYDQDIFSKKKNLIKKNIEFLGKVKDSCMEGENFENKLFTLIRTCPFPEPISTSSSKGTMRIKIGKDICIKTKIAVDFPALLDPTMSDELHNNLQSIHNIDKLKMLSLFLKSNDDNKIELITKLTETMDDLIYINIQYFRLFDAIKSKQESLLNNILSAIKKKQKSSIVNSFNGNQMPPLHYVALHGDAVAAKLLIEHGANINLRLRSRDNSAVYLGTPLHQAASKGHLGMVKLLCKRGANVNAITCEEWSTPLHLAASGGHKSVVRYLLRKAVFINAFNAQYQTPLACANGRRSIVKLLVKNGAMCESWTPLHEAAKMGNIEEVKQLIMSNNVDPNSSDPLSGYKPIHLAAKFKKHDVVEFLLENHGDEKFALCDHDDCFENKLPDWSEVSHFLSNMQKLTNNKQVYCTCTISNACFVSTSTKPKGWRNWISARLPSTVKDSYIKL